MRILSTARPEFPRGADRDLDAALADNPALRIDAWSALLTHGGSNPPNKYARKIVAVLGRTLSVGVAAVVSRADAAADAELVVHLRKWLWAVTATLVTATTTNSGAAEGIFVGLGAAMFGRVDEVLLVVGPALRLYAAASPAVLAALRAGGGEGCPILGLAVVCCGLLMRYAALPSSQRKVYDACFSSAERLGESSLVAAICGARAAAVGDLARIPAAEAGTAMEDARASGSAAVARQAARLAELTEDALAQVPFECGGAFDDVSDAFVASALLVAAATGAAAPQPQPAGGALAPEQQLVALLSDGGGAPAVVRALEEWAPPPGRTRERSIFETLFAVANGGAGGPGAAAAAAATLSALPLLLERFIRLRRESEEGAARGGRAAARRPAAAAAAPAPAAAAGAPAAPASSLTALALATVSGAPEFGVLCECLAIALGAAAGDRVTRPGAPQGAVAAGASLVFTPLSAASGAGHAPAPLRLRVVAGLLAVTLRHGLYSAHEDVAPHPQLAVLRVVAHAVLCAVEAAGSSSSGGGGSPDRALAALGALDVLLQLDHRVVQPLVERALCAAVVAAPAAGGPAAAAILAAAAGFAASLCGVYARLRALPLLLDVHWAAADRVLGAGGGADAGAAAFLAVFASPVHAQAFEAAVAGLSGGQLPEVGAHLQRQLGATAARVREAAAAAAAAAAGSQPQPPPPGASGKKRRREPAVSGGGDGGDGGGRSAAALAHFSVLASHAAAFLRHARLTPSNAVAVMGAALGLGEAGAVPILSLFDDGSARAAMPAAALAAAAAAALQLASACGAVALACTAHEGLRALVPSVIAAAVAHDARVPETVGGQSALDMLWPASAFGGMLKQPPGTAAEALVVAPSSGGAAPPRPDIRRLAAWWGALEDAGVRGPLGLALAAFAAGRLRALHAVVASEPRSSGGQRPPTPSAAAARLLSDLLLSRGPPDVASSVLDVCAGHATPARVSDFAARLFAVPPAPWQLALLRDAQLYELESVASLLPAALEKEARAAAERLRAACSLSTAAVKPGASAKKAPRLARVAAVSAGLAAVLTAPAASDAQRGAVASLVELVEQSPPPAASDVGSLPEPLGSAVLLEGEFLAFVTGLPDAAFCDAAGAAAESLAAVAFALHAAVAALGGPAALPHPGLLRLPWGSVHEPGACLVASQVRFALACGLDAQADAPAKLGAALAAAFSGEWAAAAAAGVGEREAPTPKKKRKSVEPSRGRAGESAAAEAVATRLSLALAAQLDCTGVSGGVRDTWAWRALLAAALHASKLLASSADATSRRAAAASIALVAERLCEPASADNAAAAPSTTAGRLRLAAGLSDLAGESEAALLEGGVLRFRASAAASLQAWLEAAPETRGSDSVLTCLADLLGRVSPSATTEAALEARPGGGPGPGELWAASLVAPVLLERLLFRSSTGAGAPAEGAEGADDARVTLLLMAASLVDAAPFAARAVTALAPASPVDDRRAAAAFLSACISAAALGYYRRGGAGGSSSSGGGSCERPAHLGDGSKDARDFVSAVVAAALPGAAALAAALGREPAQPSPSPPGISGSPSSSGDGGSAELVALLELLRLALSHPHVVFLGREHVKLCLEALSPLCAAADALLLRGGPDAAATAGAAAAAGLAAAALEDVDAGCRTAGELPLLVEASPAAAAVCAALLLRRGEQQHPDEEDGAAPLAPDAPLFPAASCVAASGGSAALAAALGVVRAALTYHGAAALSFWPVASQLLQAAFVVATTRGAAPGAPADGYASDAALGALARVCEDASRALAVARFHAVPLLARLLIQWAHRSPPLPARVRERLQPGLHALLDVCRPGELQALHTGLGRAGLGVVRAQLRELHAAFAAHVKYRGKL